MTAIVSKLLIKKLDSRYNGYPYFTFFVDISKPDPPYVIRHRRYIDHLLLRQWCCNQWGLSCEWDLFGISHQYEIHNPHWCWDAKEHKSRILLRGAEEVSLMCLTFDVA